MFVKNQNFWLRGWDSNPRHSAYETELEPLQSTPQYIVVPSLGLEPRFQP